MSPAFKVKYLQQNSKLRISFDKQIIPYLDINLNINKYKYDCGPRGKEYAFFIKLLNILFLDVDIRI